MCLLCLSVAPEPSDCAFSSATYCDPQDGAHASAHDQGAGLDAAPLGTVNQRTQNTDFDALPVGEIGEMATTLVNRGGQFRAFDLWAQETQGALSYNITGYDSSRDPDWTDADGLSGTRPAMVDEIVKIFSSVLGITFEKDTRRDATNTDIVYTDDFGDSGGRAVSETGDWPRISHSFVTHGSPNLNATTIGARNFGPMVHELVHALGISWHMGKYNGDVSGSDEIYYQNDGVHLSMMSYLYDNNPTAEAVKALLTPSVVDWVALDRMYGSQGYGTQNAFRGNTVYGFNTTISAQESVVYADMKHHAQNGHYTVVDGDGIDTFDLSGYGQNLLIDLTPTTLEDAGPTTTRIGEYGKITLAVGTLIENAIGGAGNDVIIGNAADNILQGNGGDDIFRPGQGDDVVRGGGGFDTVRFEGLVSDYDIQIRADHVLITGDGQDWIAKDVEQFEFLDRTLSLAELERFAGTKTGPVASDDRWSVRENQFRGDVAGQLLQNDAASGGTVVDVNGVAIGTGGWIDLDKGAVLVRPDGRVQFDPKGDFNHLFETQTETVSFTYTVQTPGGTSTATAEITVTGLGTRTTQRPEASGDVYDVSASDAEIVLGRVLDNDVHFFSTVGKINGAAFTGAQSIKLDGGGSIKMLPNGKLTFTSDGDFDDLKGDETRTVSFDYTIVNAHGTDTATVDIVVHSRASQDGTHGKDVLQGGKGQDRLSGRDGDDMLFGAAGNDSLNGGDGRDWLVGGGGRDQAVGGAGDDRIVGNGGKDWLSGEDGDDVLKGGRGNDKLFGGYGADDLRGGQGHDRLMGLSGSDMLKGGGGRDRLFGGGGNDVLKGGGDADRFIFNTFDGRDRIVDFTVGLDKLVFSGVADSMRDLTIRQKGADTVIRVEGTEIHLEDVAKADLSADDFMFV